MLKSLKIENFIIVESIELDFVTGFNVITGETGSGKSVLIDALLLLFGERASADSIRDQSKKSLIEGIFELKQPVLITKFLLENDIQDFGNELIIRRELSAKGASRAFINDSPVNLNLLKELSSELVDFHGQHDNRILLDSKSHLEILDSYGKYDRLKLNYQQNFSALNNKITEYKKIIKQKNELSQKEQFVRFQLDEIKKVNPEEDEDEKLLNELKILENAEFIHNQTQELNYNLYEKDDSAYNYFQQAKKSLEQLTDIDKSFQIYLNEIESAIVSAKEIASFAKNYAENIDFNASKIETARQRLMELRNLTRKYGEISKILTLKSELEKELNLSENFDEIIKSLLDEIYGLRIAAGNAAYELYETRKQKGEELAQGITDKLNALGIEYSVIDVAIDHKQLKSKDEELPYVIVNNLPYFADNNGIDEIEFMITTNKGINPGKMAEIASGGEISRIMLAIKSLTAGANPNKLFVFDEIDTGISGRVARKVGLGMLDISAMQQLIAITHLPQIAALGERNIAVKKDDSTGTTRAYAEILNDDDKHIEIAKLLSGETVTEHSLKSAKELAKAI